MKLATMSLSAKPDLAQIFGVIDARKGMGCRIFRPHEKQKLFFDLGAKYSARVLSGANRVGKTLTGANEAGYHLTGEYPDWWEGHRFSGPTTWWAGSTDWLTNVDGIQRALVGDVAAGALGEGFINKRTREFVPCAIPRDAIIGVVKYPQVANALLEVTVRHKSGGVSRVRFFSYQKGRERLQAAGVDGVLLDEEPPADVYAELVLRGFETAGLKILTFTPLKGITQVVQKFIGNVQVDENFPGVVTSDAGALVRISMHDAPHITDEMIEQLRGEIFEHEHMARIEGIPALGEGAVFPFPDSEISVTPFVPPVHWMVLDAIDFGFDHPTARVRGVMNPDTKAIFITQDYKASKLAPVVHAANWRREFRGRVPVIWPHDGRNTETDGVSKRQKYIDEGVQMTLDPAELPTGGNSVEGGLQLMYDDFASGKLKLFRGCANFFSEKALYRRERDKQGRAQIVKKMDDVIDAVRYVYCGLLSGHGTTIRKAFEVEVPASRLRRGIPDDDAGYDFRP